MKLTDIIIDSSTLGSSMLLVDVQPVFEYIEGKRSNNITAYKYIVTLPDKGFEKIAIKIPGTQLLESPSKAIPIEFDELQLFIYWIKGTYELGARAKGIRIIEE